MACEVWFRRDFLIKHGRVPAEPLCDHPRDLCPAEGPLPAGHPVHIDPPDNPISAEETRRLGEEQL
jgi:hypothetical protein